MSRLVLGSLVALLGGCPLAHPDAAPQSCLRDDDCFRGEYCYPPERRLGETGECRPRLDSGSPDRSRRDLPGQDRTVLDQRQRDARGEGRAPDATKDRGGTDG